MNEIEKAEINHPESNPPDALASKSIPDTSVDVESASVGEPKAAPDAVNDEPTQTVPSNDKSGLYGIVSLVLGLVVVVLAAANYMHINELRSAGSSRVVSSTKNEPKSSATTSRLDTIQSKMDRLQKSVNELLLATQEEPFPERKSTSDAVGTSGQLDELKSAIGQLQELVSGLHEDATTEPETETSTPDELVTDVKPSVDSIVELARTFEESGNHERAGYYWRNAVEHASDEILLPVLKEYARAVFKAEATDESGFAEAATLERLAELALVRVPPELMDEALAFRDECEAFRSSMLVEATSGDETTEDDEPEFKAEPIAKTIADSTEKILDELKQTIASYSGPSRKVIKEIRGGSKERSATEEECLILQLSGVAENTMSQLWFLDRSGLDAAEANRIKSFPKRLTDLIDQFNEKHDAPLLDEIQSIVTAQPPKSASSAPHQRNIEFFTNQVAEATAILRYLRGAEAQTDVQKSIASVMGKVADEKRQQMNEYQKFVANCCKLAFDSWDDTMNTGSAGYGRVPRNKGYKSETDFIGRYVRQFSRSVPLSELVSQTDRRLIYAKDNWISQALQRSTGGASYYDVANHHKAFIVTAIYGFYRIDQSLLTPETSRLFNDIFGQYYDKMDAARKAWSVRWMVEEKKVRLEDF